jgi:hypothetical protein
LHPKIIVLMAFAIASFLSGMADQYFYPGVSFPPTSVAYAVVGSLLIFAWYRLDSDQRGYRRSIGLNIGVIAIALIGLPYYLFRSRGAKRGLIATGVALVVYVASVALTYAGGLVAYFGLQT